jgi:SPX domain protein involved in polyphosphate accumulation
MCSLKKKSLSRRYEKNNFTALNFAKLLQKFWTEDDKFIHERMRIQSHLAVLLYCYTGGRIAEFISDSG